MEPLNYKEAVKRSHKEALYTLIGAVVRCVFCWGVIFFPADFEMALWGLPLWFWLACVGGYFLSVIVVWLLVKFGFKNFRFPDEEDR